MRREIYQELWWIRAPKGLSVGQRQIDSEGAVYFLIVGDSDRAYNADEVKPIAPVQQYFEKKKTAANRAVGLQGRQRAERSCGNRLLSFRGWTVFRCGKCAACRVNGHRRSSTRARTTLAGVLRA